MIYLTEQTIINVNKQLLILSNEGQQIIQYPEGLSLVIQQPQLTMFGHEIYPNIWLKSAYILQKITKKHIFNNANKRTAFVITKMFLMINGYHLKVTTQQGIDFMLKATTDSDTVEHMQWIADFLQQNSKKED